MSIDYGGSKSTPDYSVDYDQNEEGSCTYHDFYYNTPSTRIISRNYEFCKNVTINGDLVVKGDVTVLGNITCSGTITAPTFNGTATRAIVASSLG